MKVDFIIVLLTGLLLGITSNAVAGDNEQSGTGAEKQQDSVTVESYETRPEPTHEVSLHDDRVYFVKELEETETGYILHTLEDEVIEVERDEVAEIKDLGED